MSETADSYQLPLITLLFRGWRCFLQPGVFTSLPLMKTRTNIRTSVRQCKTGGEKRRALLRASSTFKHETPKKNPTFVHAKGSGRGGELGVNHCKTDPGTLILDHTVEHGSTNNGGVVSVRQQTLITASKDLLTRRGNLVFASTHYC